MNTSESLGSVDRWHRTAEDRFKILIKCLREVKTKVQGEYW